MENSHVINFEKASSKTVQDYQEYVKWTRASRTPLLMSTGNILGIEGSFPLENRIILSLNHYKDLEHYFNYTRSQEFNVFQDDTRISWSKKLEYSWRACYLVVKRFNVAQRYSIDKGNIFDKNTYLKEFAQESAPVVLIKGLALSQEDWEKYDTWMNRWGYDIYLPVLLKAPGIIEYCRCWLSNINRTPWPKPSYKINAEFPQDVSIIYFENWRSYQNFLRSKELEAYNENIHKAFPEELNYSWDIAIQIARRWTI